MNATMPGFRECRKIAAGGLATILLASGCEKALTSLEPEQKMAYGVKPAVVRVNAYSTAELHYPAQTLQTLDAELKKKSPSILRQNPASPIGVTETGAGGSGTGFVIHPSGYILTSGHVVASTRSRPELERELKKNGAIATLLQHYPVEILRALYHERQLDGIIDQLALASSLENVKVVNEIELSNGEHFPFTVRSWSPSLTQRGTDVALLKIARAELPTLELGDSEQVHIQQPVWVVGYPAVANSTDEVIGGWLSQESDLEATINSGSITAIKRDVTRAPVFQTDVAIYRGNSGGPAVNRQGDVIGIATWGHTSADQIKFLVPINLARDLLKAAKIPLGTRGKFNAAYDQALDDAWANEWRRAKANLQEADRHFRGSPDVIRLMRDAERAMTSEPFWRAHPFVTLVGFTIVVVGLAALAMALAHHRVPSRAMPLIPDPKREKLVAPGSRGSGSEVTELNSLAPRPGNGSLLGRFTILNGECAGERFGLGGSGIRIGREKSICEIVLENPKVSRLHAEVVSIDGKVLLIDRNSSNGTFVNDRKIEKTYLEDGDIIYFGGRNAVAVAFHT